MELLLNAHCGHPLDPDWTIPRVSVPIFVEHLKSMGWGHLLICQDPEAYLKKVLPTVSTNRQTYGYVPLGEGVNAWFHNWKPHQAALATSLFKEELLRKASERASLATASSTHTGQ